MGAKIFLVAHALNTKTAQPQGDGGTLRPEISDEQLVLAFRTGDARAFETLVRRHRTQVFNFVLRFTGHRARAEDILQDTWLRLIRNLQDYEPKAKFTTWLYTVARNMCLDHARKQRYRDAVSLDAPEGRDTDRPPLSAALPSNLPSPERGAHNQALRPLLERALLSIPDEQREVFILREYSGIPFREIAEVTGVPENTVKSRMRYALEALRKKLAELGVDGDLADEGRTVA